MATAKTAWQRKKARRKAAPKRKATPKKKGAKKKAAAKRKRAAKKAAKKAAKRTHRQGHRRAVRRTVRKSRTTQTTKARKSRGRKVAKKKAAPKRKVAKRKAAKKKAAPKRKVAKRKVAKRKAAKKKAAPKRKVAKCKVSKRASKIRGAKAKASKVRAPELSPEVSALELLGPETLPPVPVEELAEPEAGKIYIRSTADAMWYDEGKGYQIARAMINSHGNSMYNSELDMVLSNYFKAYAKRNNFDEDMIPVFRYGVNFRARGPYTEEQVAAMAHDMEKRLAEILPDGWAAHIVKESGTLSVRVAAGSYDQFCGMKDAINEIGRDKSTWDDIYTTIWEAWEETDWFAFADIDSEYDRPSA